MIIISNALIPHEEITYVKDITSIKSTKANSTIIFDYDEKILAYVSKNALFFAVKIKSIKEAIFCNALNAKYIICENSKAKEIQDLAENYMFDSKVLTYITSDDELEEFAKLGIDGVIYKDKM